MPDIQITITGIEEVKLLCDELHQRLGDLGAHVAFLVAEYMRDVVPVATGYLKSTIHSEGPYAIADAPYAGYVADMGGSHDFPVLAENLLSEETIADWLMEGL